MANRKLNIQVTLRNRQLTEREAAELRALIEEQRPKVHLVKADWPWLEVRGLSEPGAQQIVERIRKIAPQCIVAGETHRIQIAGERKTDAANLHHMHTLTTQRG